MLLGKEWMTLSKAGGMLFSLHIVIPVFAFLRRALKKGNPMHFFKTFVGGFLFKLIGILAGVWWVFKYSSLDRNDFLIGSLVFLFTLQISEAIYFWGFSKEQFGEQSN